MELHLEKSESNSAFQELYLITFKNIRYESFTLQNLLIPLNLLLFHQLQSSIPTANKQ